MAPLVIVAQDSSAQCPTGLQREVDASCAYVVEDFSGQMLVAVAFDPVFTQIPAPGTVLGPGVYSIEVDAALNDNSNRNKRY